MSETQTLRLLRIATALSFFLALVNHLLPPQAFSITQLLFDYEFGLTRRGLTGEVLNYFIGPQVTLSEIFAAAALLTFFGAVAFYLYLNRVGARSVAYDLLIILALNSFAFASFVGNTGYLDAVLMVITVLALQSDGSKPLGVVLRLLLVVVGVLVHENMLPFFTVLIGFDLWLARKPGTSTLAKAVLPAALGFAAVLLMSALFVQTPEQAEAFVEYINSKARFVVDPTATDVAKRALADNFAMMHEMRASASYKAWVLFDGVPLALMSLWLIWLNLRLLGQKAGTLTRLMAIGAIIAPMSLNLIAFDVVRFGAMSVLVGFIVVALIIRHRPEALDRLAQTLTWPHFLVVLVLNVNMFTIQVNSGAGHMSQFPWVLLRQLEWLSP